MARSKAENAREQSKKKLAERLQNPRVPQSKSSGHKDRYKIKLRSVRYRLIYQDLDAEVVVLVIAVGKLDRQGVCKAAEKR
jgi:mRNA interferase RelE/StbE